MKRVLLIVLFTASTIIETHQPSKGTIEKRYEVPQVLQEANRVIFTILIRQRQMRNQRIAQVINNNEDVNGSFNNRPYVEWLVITRSHYWLGQLLQRGACEDLDRLISLSRECNNIPAQLLVQHFQRKRLQESADQSVQNVFKQYFVMKQLKQQQDLS